MCVRCSGISRSLDRLVAVAEFEGSAREAVHTLKFNGRYAIAGLMGRLMAEVSRDVDADLIVPVPLHRTRLRERGYDQSALLARSVAKSLTRPYRPSALRRRRPTRQQASLPAHERRSNVAGAFESSDTWHGEAILLLDDVTTTGATLDAAASALRQVGAGQITGLVFAIAV
jgi:ComF family protein